MSAERQCACPHKVQSLGRLYGINMGKGVVCTGTTPGCPEHDSCHGWTKARRAAQPAWSNPWCPLHETRNCPEGAR